MSFFGGLFGKRKQKYEDEPGIEEHLDYLNTLRIPAIALKASAGPASSRIGGLPSLPGGVSWPEWKGAPLAFLCQLDLGEIPQECDRMGLPQSGMLYFFYNQEQETWGFDPKDKGSWQVIYADTKISGNELARAAPQGLNEDCIFAEKHIGCFPVQTYPDWQDERVGALSLNDLQGDQYIDDLCSKVFQGAPRHQMFGYPSPVQGNDMDLECQLVSNGLYCGNSTGYEDPRAKQLEAGRPDWVLLLQLDTDDDIDMMWGDCGMLYFWIRKADLEEKRFDRCWMILQCS